MRRVAPIAEASATSIGKPIITGLQPMALALATTKPRTGWGNASTGKGFQGRTAGAGGSGWIGSASLYEGNVAVMGQLPQQAG
jgi:hypothetical protein